jgi:hypothetical protein
MSTKPAPHPAPPLHPAFTSRLMEEAKTAVTEAVEALNDSDWGDISLEQAETKLSLAMSLIYDMRRMR